MWLWQTILFASILFHHGNLRLPRKFEGMMVRLFVTPRMHGIHHSDRREETIATGRACYRCGTGFTAPCVDVPDETIRIGVPAYRDSTDVSFTHIQLMPLVPQREDWRDGCSSA